MKILLPVLTLVLGFGIGWWICDARIWKNEESIRQDEFRKTLEAVDMDVGPGVTREMFLESREFVSGNPPMTVEQARKYVREVQEIQSELDAKREASMAKEREDLRILWLAIGAREFRDLVEERGGTSVVEHADRSIAAFRKSYQEGLSLGEVQGLADELYLATKPGARSGSDD